MNGCDPAIGLVVHGCGVFSHEVRVGDARSVHAARGGGFFVWLFYFSFMLLVVIFL